MKAVLCIGGLDPAGRAGLLADARAVEAMGARPLCVATALTYQSSKRMEGYHPVAPDVIGRQLELLLRDEEIGAIKIGQLATAEIARVVEGVIALPCDFTSRPVVLDTPLASSSGSALFSAGDVTTAYAPLLAKATLVTPNAVEVFLLAGRTPSANREEAETVARKLGCRAVLLKGGHLSGDDIVDVLMTGDGRQSFASPRVPGRFRGTGCRLASAIAARLALGSPLSEAIGAAREWLIGQLQRDAAV